MGLIPEANNGESEKKGSKVVVYPADSTVPAVYEGAQTGSATIFRVDLLNCRRSDQIRVLV
jgi:hypothetical protein